MPFAISVDKATNRVMGNQRSGALVVGEIHDAGNYWRVVLTDPQEIEFRAKRADADGDGRKETVYYDKDTKVFTVPADARPTIVATSPDTAIDADGVDVATITLAATPAIDGGRKFKLGDEYFRAQFVSGVATITYTTRQSGKFTISSNDQFKIPTPLVIEAFRV